MNIQARFEDVESAVRNYVAAARHDALTTQRGDYHTAMIALVKDVRKLEDTLVALQHRARLALNKPDGEQDAGEFRDICQTLIGDQS
jgi:hypothetical protein